jgi:pimeloyl-ACP methyl ester carboxylesterase
MSARTTASFIVALICGVQFSIVTWAQVEHSALHKALFVTVDGDIRLEVLDWGGQGQTLVFLAGLGNTAHVFDEFAPRFADRFRVVGITRRGFGASSRPSVGYDVQRLSKDVLVVIEALRLERPILVGHSIAGEELSYIAAQEGKRIGGLVYLDAAYDRTGEIAALSQEWPQAAPERLPSERYREFSLRTRGYALPESDLEQYQRFGDPPADVSRTIMAGVLVPDYKNIDASALAFYALPQSAKHLFPAYSVLSPDVQRRIDAFWPRWATQVQRARERFHHEVRRGATVTLNGGTHYMFLSNSEQTATRMRTFFDTLQTTR